MSALSQGTGHRPGAPVVLRSVLDRGTVQGNLRTSRNTGMPLIFYSCPNPPSSHAREAPDAAGAWKTQNAPYLVIVSDARNALGKAVCYHRLSQVVTPYTE